MTNVVHTTRSRCWAGVFAALVSAAAWNIGAISHAQGWRTDPPTAASQAMEAFTATPPASPNYFPSIPANFLEQAQPYHPGMMDRNVMPASYMPAAPDDEESVEEGDESDEIAVPRGPNFFRAERIEPPRSPSYFPSLPADFSANVPYYEPSAGAVGPGGYPGELTQFQAPLVGGGQAATGAGPALFNVRLNLSGRRRALRARQYEMSRRWAVTTEFMMLTEGSKPAGSAIISDFGTDQPLLNAQDLKGPWGFGPRVAATRYLRGEATAVQIAYFGIFEWDRGTTVLGDNSLRLAGDIALATVDYIGADAMTVEYESQIQNVEINLVQGLISARNRWVIGSRYINWLDRLQIESTDLDAFTSSSFVRTTNNLVGGHAGLDHLFDTDLGDFTLRLRGGVFANPASQTTVISDLDNAFELRNVSVTTVDVAYLGEAGLFYSFAPSDSVDFRLGYNLMWFEGLARAPANLDLTDTVDSSTTVDTNGSAFLHGLTAGATFSW